ncbi:MAG: hypothetical protein CV089_23910 [Nitrospira sp. WS110]|nr:hypothetical protein [Nitrospira sp. WS110]
MAQKFLSIKNFEKYQHYKKRMPPWIKLYKSMFGDPAFQKLTVMGRYLYIGLLTLASENDNRVLNDPSWIAQRLVISPSDVDLKPLYRSGFLLASEASIRRYHKTETESSLKKEKQRQKTEAETEDTSAAVAKSTLRPVSRDTWESYSSAYLTRYSKPPVRNQKVNAQLAQLVKRLGSDDAPKIAAFYLTHNKPIYVSSRHCTDLLLRDAEGLHTEWVTGVKATTGEARNAERRDDAMAQIERVRRTMEGN